MSPDSQGTAAFGALLARRPGKKVARTEFWDDFAEAFPVRPTGVRVEREWLLFALRALEADGQLQLPSKRGKHWDKSVQPFVPTQITRIVSPPTKDQSWRNRPWHPRLAWVSGLPQLTDEQVGFLRKVNEGFARGWFDKPAPLRYRSIQLTGDEKRLMQLAKGSLFATGRLSYKMLGCLREHTPLAWERVGASNLMIVFENAGPFHVAREVLSSLATPPYGLIAYGGGAGFRRSVVYLGTIGEPITRIEYVGDLDRPGLRIAAAAQVAAAAAGLPPLVAAAGVHAAMLEAAARFGHPTGWVYRKARPVQDLELLEFLPLNVRERAQGLLRIGHRVPEEVLGPAELSDLWVRTVVRAN